MTEQAPLWLVVEEGALAGTSLRLEDQPVVIGRDRSADLRMDAHQDRLVSGRHALITPSDGGWFLEDLGSTNGTLVDGERVRGTRRLQPGQRIRFGNTGPVVLFTDDRSAATVRADGPTPPTRMMSVLGPRRSRIVAGGLAVAGIAGLLAFWAGRATPEPPQQDGAEWPEAAATDASGEEGDDRVAAADLESADSLAARQSREIAALRQQIEGLQERIRRSEGESERLRTALDAAEARGASQEEIRMLERRLDDANSALRRQQLAASLDFETIGDLTRPATAQIYVEFEGSHVVIATAFGIDGEGRLLTNKHVVRDDDGRALRRIGIRYPGQQGVVPARVVRTSPVDDLAMVELTDPRTPTPAVAGFNMSADTLSEGTPLAISGFPLSGGSPEDGRGPQPVLSAGVLMGRDGSYLEIEGYGRSGASGSPILDSDGLVVGVLLGGTRGESGERLYALPASRVMAFLSLVSGTR